MIGLTRAQRADQNSGVNGLGQKFIEAGFLRLSSQVPGAASRQRDKSKGPVFGIAAQLSRSLESVDFRHVEIEEHCIGIHLLAQKDGFGDALASVHVETLVGKQGRDGFPDQIIVVYVDDRQSLILHSGRSSQIIGRAGKLFDCEDRKAKLLFDNTPSPLLRL